MRRCLIGGFVLVVILAASTFAGTNTSAKVAVHAVPHASRSCTKSFPTITACQDISYSEQAMDVDCFPVFFDLAEYQGFDYGLTWPGLYTCVFTSCSDLTIGGIVSPGEGVSHAWTVCQDAQVAVTGWAWIVDVGLVCVVAHPEIGTINIGDCQDPTGIDQPVGNYCAGIGGEPGQDPCQPTAIEASTWGAIKSMFK